MKSIVKDFESNNPVSQILLLKQNINEFRGNLLPLINIGNKFSCNVTKFISNKLCNMSNTITNLLKNTQIITNKLNNLSNKLDGGDARYIEFKNNLDLLEININKLINSSGDFLKKGLSVPCVLSRNISNVVCNSTLLLNPKHFIGNFINLGQKSIESGKTLLKKVYNSEQSGGNMGYQYISDPYTTNIYDINNNYGRNVLYKYLQYYKINN